MVFRDLAWLSAWALLALGVRAFSATRLVLAEHSLALVTLVEWVLVTQSITRITVWVFLLLRSNDVLIEVSRSCPVGTYGSLGQSVQRMC